MLKVGTLKLGAAGDGARCCCDTKVGTGCDSGGAAGDIVDSRCTLVGNVNCCTEVLTSPWYIDVVCRLSLRVGDHCGMSAWRFTGEGPGDESLEVEVVFPAVDAYDCRGLSFNRSRWI